MTYPIGHELNSEALYEETMRRRAEMERKMDFVSDRCRCNRPVEGPTYLRCTRCRVCGRKVG